MQKLHGPDVPPLLETVASLPSPSSIRRRALFGSAAKALTYWDALGHMYQCQIEQLPSYATCDSGLVPTEFQLLNDAIQQAGNKCLSAATPTHSVQQA